MRGNNERPIQHGGQREDHLWSVKLLEVSGIPIRLHFTFLLLMAWVSFGALQGREAMLNALFIGGIFLCVLLHELGHALTAKRCGIGTRDIVLYPIGGIASIDKPPRPKEELVIALAGPAVNVVIAGVLFVVSEVLGHRYLVQKLVMSDAFWIEKLMVANLILAAFNMIPAFPMDGGRVLRAALALRIGELRATEIAAQLGQGIAMLIGLYALLYQPYLLFIALFVYLGAGAELNVQQGRALAEGASVEDAMITHFTTLGQGDTLRIAAEILLRGSQQDFPVLQGLEMVGYLTREDLLRGLGTTGRDGYVAGSMRREFPTTSPSTDLADLLEAMREEGVTSMPVVDHGRIVGMITAENVGEYFAVKREAQKVPEDRL